MCNVGGWVSDISHAVNSVTDGVSKTLGTDGSNNGLLQGSLGGASDVISATGKDIANSPLANAALSVGGSLIGVPPAVTAGLLGANTTAQTGDVGAGLLAGLGSLGTQALAGSVAGSATAGVPSSATGGAFDFSPSLGGIAQGVGSAVKDVVGGVAGGIGNAIQPSSGGSFDFSPTIGGVLQGVGDAVKDVAGGVVGGLAGSSGSTLGAIAGAALGAAGSKDTTTTSNKDPWGPAQSYLRDNLAQNALMQRYYLANPFSAEQKAAYQSAANAHANAQANIAGLLGNASNFMNSRGGVIPRMAALTHGTNAPEINWANYVNIGQPRG